MPGTDQELLRQYVRERSQAAFAELVERHKNWVYSACLRRLRDPHRAEDAAQAAFIALARKAPALMRHQSVAGWLYHAARFVTSDIRKLEQRRAQREAEVAHMHAPSADPGAPASSALEPWSDIAPHLEPALDRLPEKYRLALLLRFYQQKSHGEIAAALGISEPAAQKRVARGLEFLRAKLAAHAGTTTASSLGAMLTAQVIQTAPATLSGGSVASALSAAGGATWSLSQGALHMMYLAKLKTLAIAASFVLVVVGGGAALTAVLAQHAEPAARAAAPAPAQTAAASAPDVSADPRVRVIAPYFSADNVMIVHADATAIDTAALEKTINEAMALVPGVRPADLDLMTKKIAALRLMADAFLDPFKKAGGKDAYALFSQAADNAPRIVGVVLPLQPGADVKALQNLLLTIPGTDARNIVATDKMIVVGEPEFVATAQNPTGAARPDLAQALAAASSDIQIAIALPERSRAVFASHMGKIPREGGGGSIALLYRSLKHLSVSIHLSSDPSAALEARFDSPANAKETVDIWNHMIELLAQECAAHIPNAPPGGIDGLKSALTATAEGDVGRLQLNAQQVRSGMASMAVIMPAIAKDQRNRGAGPNSVPANYIRQNLMAALMYAADNKDAWPADLNVLVAKGYLPDEKTLIDPRDPARHRVFEYHPWAPEELKRLDASTAPVIWDPIDNDNTPINVGYADGHVATLPGKTALEAQLASARAQLKQP